MTQAVLFVDAAKAARSDPGLVSRALGIDAYRARLLLNARAPFLAHGFPDLASAERAAAALRQGHVPATAHARARVDAVPAPREITAISRAGKRDAWKALTDGGAVEIPFESLVALVHGKLTVQFEGGSESGDPLLAGVPLFGGAKRRRPAGEAREPLHLFRLDVFCRSPEGTAARFSVRHDRFDFRCLGGRKTLSAVRNVAALRDLLAQTRPPELGGDVPACDAFDKTELARTALASDVFVHADLRSGASRSETVRSNREAFETYAALRFLHEAALRPSRPSHHYEL